MFSNEPYKSFVKKKNMSWTNIESIKLKKDFGSGYAKVFA